MDRVAAYRRGLATAGFAVLAAGDALRSLLSWWGWGAIAAVVLALIVAELVRMRAGLRRLPLTLVAVLVVMAASIAWSAYPAESALGVAATVATTAAALFLALLPFPHALDAFADAARGILGLSLLFELAVAAFVRGPVLPLWVDYSHLDRIPAAFYWSRGLLFEGGRIQGIVGNANLLAMVALLALVAFAVRLAARRGSVAWGWAWIVVAVAVLALTRSTTVIVAAAVTGFAAVVLVLARRASGARRVLVHAGAVAVLAAAVVAAVVFRGPLLELAGRRADLTNRLEIWDVVAGLVAERPFAGWGWVGYWPPWVEPFRDLVVIRGVTYLQAHNAWLDTALQLGAVGLVVMAAFAGIAFLRSWRAALVPAGTPALTPAGTPPAPPRGGMPWPLAAAPALWLVALLVQSLAESRLLTELGWALLAWTAIALAPAARTAASAPAPARAAP